MQANAVDHLRRAPQPAAPANAPQPKSRFDDVLSHRVRSKNETPKPESPKHVDATKKAGPKKTDVAKKEHADDATPVESDDTTASDDESDAVDAEAAQADAKPVTKTDAKKKPSGKSAADTDAACDVEEPTDAAAKKTTSTTAATGDAAKLAIQPEDTAGDDAAADTDVDPTTTDVTPDSLALAAQLATPPAAVPESAEKPAASDEASAPTTTAVATAAKSKAATALGTAGPESATGDVEHRPTLKPHEAKAPEVSDDDAAWMPLPPDADKSASKLPTASDDDATARAAVQQPAAPHDKSAAAALPVVTAPDAGPQKTVAEDNVDRIVTSVRGELMKTGGRMEIRLDPPTLGHIQVQIDVNDGVFSASIQTNNEEATRLLSHNLAQLKTQLESTGVTVDHIQVKQATPAEQTSSSQQGNADGDSRQSGNAAQDQSARQEQQRKEMLQRMWAKLAGSGDPLDLVA